MTTILRTLTLGIGDPHPLGNGEIARAATVLRRAQAQAEAAGYTVQTVRIATRPLLEDMATASDQDVERYAAGLQARCERASLAYCSLGPAPAYDSTFPLARLAMLPRILGSSPALSATVQLAVAGHPPRLPAARATAEVIRTLAAQGDGGENFRFAALALCEPGGPFFPQAYAPAGRWQLSVGLQSASVVAQAITKAFTGASSGGDEGTRRSPEADADVGAVVTRAVREAMRSVAEPVVALVRRFAEDAGVGFGGIDLSPAPMGEDSIVGAFEAAGLGRFGGPGTLTVAAAMTAALKSTELPTCGYCGLMLPVLEDALLGSRCAEQVMSPTTLLSYSAVCGTGLDTIPLPGGTPLAALAALLMDVATLAYRLHKPLSARLFLVPGARAGELTRFASPFLTNTRVMTL